MNKAFRLTMAKQKGEAVVKELGIDKLPIDPIAIAVKRGIVVQPKSDTEEGVSGMLLRHGNNFGIMYATYTGNEGFEHFSVGHELGHYFLDGHIDHILPGPNDAHASRAGFASDDPYEREADNFAVGLLMPGFFFRREMNKHDDGLAAVEDLATLCQTSLTATASRYAELATGAVAMIVCNPRGIEYCCLSGCMKSLKQITWPRRGSVIPRGTVTQQVVSDPKRIARGDRAEAEVDITDWLGGDRSVNAVEEVMGLGKYGKTLTILTCPSLMDDTYKDEEDEEDDDDVAERWTPRFK